MFQEADYRGHNFLSLKKTDGSSLQPTYINGGVWLSPVGGDLTVAVRLFRCILNHAPIGSYYERFNIDESLDCECGFRQQTRDHVLLSCTKLERKDNSLKSPVTHSGLQVSSITYITIQPVTHSGLQLFIVPQSFGLGVPY